MRGQAASSGDRKWRQEPTCDELRNLWRASVQEMSKQLGFFVFPGDVEKVLNNPYYRSILRSPGHFGHILTETNEIRPPSSVLYGHTVRYPGSFGEAEVEPEKSETSYGDVIFSPDEGVRKSGTFGDMVVVGSPSSGKQQKEQEHGSQDHSLKQEEQYSAVTSSPGVTADGSEHQSSMSRQQKSADTNGESGKMTANDFFNSVWHDGPIKF